jgi:probable F420-dependent oxidoreductase
VSPTFGFVIPTYGEYADPERTLRLVQVAEELGYDDVWLGDRLVVPTYALPFSDPNWFEALTTGFMALGATSRLRVGTDVVVLPLREPLTLGRMVATADVLSGGRFILGVGVGYLRGEFEALGVPYGDRGALTDEYLEVLEQVFAAENPVSHEGPGRSFADIHVGPRPGGGAVPVWVGGNHPRALRRVARFGSGWHPLFPGIEEYAAGRAEIEALRAGAESLPVGGAGAGAGAFTYSYSCPETKVLERRQEVFHSYTHDDAGTLPPDFTYAPPPPTDERGRPRFIGTADEMVEDIELFAAAGVEHFTLRFWAGNPGFPVEAFEEQLATFMSDVVPRVS